MLIKTEEFLKSFNTNINQIQISKHSPVYLKGSYKIKKIGSIITDIDLGEKIRPSPNVLKRIIQIINTSKNFIFVKMECGTYNEFITPWTIGSEGGCEYNPEKARTWVYKISNIIDSETKDIITNLLFGEFISLKNLLKIKDLLLPYSEIVWNKQDIQNGFKIVRGIKYNLLELMLNYNTVIEYIYRYKVGTHTEFCHVDFGCDSVITKPPEILYQYYKDNKYKIFKSYKWYLKDEYRDKFTDVINSIESISGLLNRIELFNNVMRFKLLTINDRKYLLNDCIQQSKLHGFEFTKNNIDDILKKLSQKIENIVVTQIPIFRKKLKERFEPMLIYYEMNSNIAEKAISQQELQKNIKYGFKCPFFTIMKEDFSFIYNISKRTGLDSQLIIHCLKNVSKTFDIPITLVVNTIFSKNNWTIQKDKEKFNVMDGVKILKRFSKLKDSQRYVLTSTLQH
jgi:hypothetical protein